MHSHNYIHNDIKLENIVVGHQDPDKIYLIDFGLTQKFVDLNGDHIEKTYIRKFSGNFLFASLNSCRGYNKSRRDDIESAFYLLIYLLNQCYLPWCDFEQRFANQQIEFKDLLRERLHISYTRKLFKMIPSKCFCFSTPYLYAR